MGIKSTEQQPRSWAGRASDYTTDDEVALSFEALTKPEVLIQAGWTSLRSWMDSQLSDIASGRRSSPVATS